MFWSKADELSSATGKHAKAVQNNIRAENAGDPLHTGYGDVWETMMKVFQGYHKNTKHQKPYLIKDENKSF
eukprot:2078519-Amphidinium_carterae.1